LTFWAQHKEQYPRLEGCTNFTKSSIQGLKAVQTSPEALFHIHATSAAMERCFSTAGYIASARRSSLSDDMLEALLIAKCNGQ